MGSTHKHVVRIFPIFLAYRAKVLNIDAKLSLLDSKRRPVIHFKYSEVKADFPYRSVLQFIEIEPSILWEQIFLNILEVDRNVARSRPTLAMSAMVFTVL